MKYIYTGKKENNGRSIQCTEGDTCSSSIQGNKMDDSKEELLCKNNVLFKSTRMLPTCFTDSQGNDPKGNQISSSFNWGIYMYYDYTYRFLLTDYVGLIWHSTAEVTAVGSTVEGTL